MAKLNEKETIKVFKELKDLLEDLSATYDLSEHSGEVEDAVFLIEEIIGPDPKKKKKKKTDWKDEIVEYYLELFDRYPTLEILPIYSWGRYYKYECAGSPFECVAGERSFVDLMCDLVSGEIKNQMDEELLEQIDEENEDFDGYLPDRKKVVEKFRGDDGRGGKCLIIVKKKTSTGYSFVLDTEDCDSPE